MNLKGLFLIGSGLVFLAVVGVAFFYLRQVAAQTDQSRRAMQVDSDCAAQVQRGIQLVVHPAKDTESLNHATGSASHYNRLLNTCYVEVASYDAEAAVYMKTLVNPAEGSAVLWSVTKRSDGSDRQCFGADSKAIDCAEADKRWKTFMKE